MNKEELELRIKELKEDLSEAQAKLMIFNGSSYWFPPNDGEKYYFVNDEGKIISSTNTYHHIDEHRIDFYNCFRSEGEAEQEKDKILVRRMLENIADRLNSGKKIDWMNIDQYKYNIAYLYSDDGHLYCHLNCDAKQEGTVYCLSEDFLDVAKEEIGEEHLIKYIKGE